MSDRLTMTVKANNIRIIQPASLLGTRAYEIHGGTWLVGYLLAQGRITQEQHDRKVRMLRTRRKRRGK